MAENALPGRNLVGAGFMVAAMSLFAVEDALFKSVTVTMGPGQATVLFGLAGLAIYVALSRRAKEPVLTPEILRPHLLIRTGFEIVGRLFFALALAFAPLSITSAILQAAPLVVVAGAALFLGETVGRRRWTAMSVGFVGVLLILRPTPEQFRPEALFALAGMIGFAGRDLATRASPVTVSARQLGTLGFLVVTCAGFLILPFDAAPPRLPVSAEAGKLLLTGCVGVAAYTALTRAMRTGEVAVVAPFRYSRLLVALVFAVVFFDERPDALVLTGAALIVGSGLYTLARSQRT